MTIFPIDEYYNDVDLYEINGNLFLFWKEEHPEVNDVFVYFGKKYLVDRIKTYEGYCTLVYVQPLTQ